MSQVPASRTQMWLARGGIVASIVLLVLLRTIGFGEVQTVRNDDATIYTSSLVELLWLSAMGVIACVIAVVFWLQPGRQYRFGSVILFMAAAYVFLMLPSSVTHRVVVSPNSFSRRVGYWFAPEVVQFDFSRIVYLDVVEVAPNVGHKTNYELQVVTETEEKERYIPIFDMMRKALPEIIRSAEAHGAMIGENADRWRVAG